MFTQIIFRTNLFIFFISLLGQPLIAETDHCKKAIAQDLNSPQKSGPKENRDLLNHLKVQTYKWRGYGILVTTMLATAAATSYLTSALPQSTQFLGIFVSQLSTIGIIVFGAPIWEKLFSRLRKNAYGLSENANLSQLPLSSSHLEAIWKKSQATYSQNAQMSRNLLNQFLIALKQNLDAALASIEKTGEISPYAVDQMAEILIRARLLYSEIPMNDPSVQLTAQTALTSHIDQKILEDLFKQVLSRIEALDLESSAPKVNQQYIDNLHDLLRIKHD